MSEFVSESPRPMSWLRAPLGEVCRSGGGSIQTGPFGSQLHADDYKDDGVPIITVEHLREGKIVHENLPLVGAGDCQRLRRYELACGDLVFSRVGAIDRCAFVSEIENGWLFSGRCLRVRTGRGQAASRFLSYLLNSWPQRQWILNHSVGSTMACLNTAILSDVPIDLPPLEEQHRIAEILSTLDETIEQTEALIAKYQQIKAGLMHDLFTRGVTSDGKLRPTHTEAPQFYKESPLGWIPKEWETELLDRLAIRGSGHTPNKNQAEFWNGGIKWVSLADSWRLDRVYISETDNEISELGIQNSSAVLHPPGIVVLSRDAGVGKSAITTCSMAVSQHFMCWRCGPRLDNHFLYYWLQDRKRDFENIATGSTIPTIGLRFFKHYRINVPKDVDEQRRIGSGLLSLDKTIFALEADVQKLRQQKHGLMHDLLTGRVRVKVAESEARLES